MLEVQQMKKNSSLTDQVKQKRMILVGHFQSRIFCEFVLISLIQNCSSKVLMLV